MIGPHCKKIKNNHGNKTLEYCIQNNLIIANRFYQHKEIHQHTRQMSSRRDTSIINCILVKEHRHMVKDVRSRRGPQIYSYHFMVVAKIRYNTIKAVRETVEITEV